MEDSALVWLTIAASAALVATALAWALTPAADRIGHALRLLDAPDDGRKRHVAVTSRSGGIAVFLAFYATVLGGMTLGPPVVAALAPPALAERAVPFLANVGAVRGPAAAVLVGGVGMFLLGLLDDRRALGPRTKLTVQVGIAAAVCLAGVSAKAFLPAPVALVLSVGWILLITNAFNLLDNSDGLSSGVAALTALGFASIAWLSGEWLQTATWCALAGATAGFWRWNFWRGRPFLGDGGALLVGFLFGALSLRTTYYLPGVPTGLPVLTPLILLALPLFDTLSVIHIRWRAGQPLMQGDRNHFSHRLEDLGLPRRTAVLAHYLVVVQLVMIAWALRGAPAVPAVGLLAVVAIQFLMIHGIERAAADARSPAP